jgi:transposase-like protein
LTAPPPPPPRTFRQTVELGLKPIRSVVMESCVLFQQTRTSKRNSKIVRGTRRFGKRLCTVYGRSWRASQLTDCHLTSGLLFEMWTKQFVTMTKGDLSLWQPQQLLGTPKRQDYHWNEIYKKKKFRRLEFDAWTNERNGMECKLKRNCMFIEYKKIGGNIYTTKRKKNKTVGWLI